jgi:alpha-glucosidase
MAADLPENYEGHPAFQFIKDVPTDWETSICINGEIGQYITMVRKDIASNDWFLGSITNEKSRELSVRLSFLDPGKRYTATIYKDPEAGGWNKKPEEVVIENQIVESGSTLNIILPSGGGQAIKFSPVM